MVFANDTLLNCSKLRDSEFNYLEAEYAIRHMLYLAVTLSDRTLDSRMFALQMDVIMQPVFDYINNLFLLSPLYDNILLDSKLALIWIASPDYKFWEKVMAPDRKMMDEFAKMTGLDNISIPKINMGMDAAQPEKG